ncbi:MAG: hypothetical protein AAB533_00055 [Patescibacteria group bacterium]
MIGWVKIVAKRHWAALALALVVSGVYGSHHLFISRILLAQGAAYRPLTFAAHADTSVYGIRANAVYGGQWLAGDISIPAYAGNPSALPLLNSFIMGGLGRLLRSLERAFILSDFLFPPLIFVALYFLAFELTRARALAIFFAAFFIFIPKAILSFPPVSWPLLQTLLQRVLPDPSGILYFVRFDYPKITFLFSAPALYGTLRAVRRQERWSVWLAGICLGLMFYTYLYDWVYFFIGISLMGVMLALSGRYRACMRLVQIAGIGLVLSGAYWYNFFLLRQLPQYQDIAARIGVETGGFLRWASVEKSYARIAILVVALWYLAPKRERASALYLSGLLLAFVAAVNIQIVTGFNPHPDHWYKISFLPLALAMLSAGYWALLRWVPPRALASGAVIAAVATGLVFGRSVASQYYYSKKDAPYYTVDRSYAAAYDWIAEQAPPRSLVASLDTLTNNELTLYAPQRTFLLNGLHTTAPDEKIWRRLMETAAVFGVSAEEFPALLRKDDLIFYLFLNEYGDRSFDGAFRNDERSKRVIPDAVRERMTRVYLRMRAEAKPEEIVLGADYVVVGPREEAVSSFRLLQNLEKAYDAEGVRVYRVIKK